MSLWPGDKALSWAQRFWRRVERAEGCWLWTGGKGGTPTHQYGVYMLPGQVRRGAHVIAYELRNGSLPSGHVIDHLCTNSLCVNPAHLEAVTASENRRRQSVRKTRCKHGHPLAGDNLYVDKRGHRACIICRRETSTRCQRERRRLLREAT